MQQSNANYSHPVTGFLSGRPQQPAASFPNQPSEPTRQHMSLGGNPRVESPRDMQTRIDQQSQTRSSFANQPPTNTETNSELPLWKTYKTPDYAYVNQHRANSTQNPELPLWKTYKPPEYAYVNQRPARAETSSDLPLWKTYKPPEYAFVNQRPARAETDSELPLWKTYKPPEYAFMNQHPARAETDSELPLRKTYKPPKYAFANQPPVNSATNSNHMRLEASNSPPQQIALKTPVQTRMTYAAALKGRSELPSPALPRSPREYVSVPKNTSFQTEIQKGGMVREETVRTWLADIRDDVPVQRPVPTFPPVPPELIATGIHRQLTPQEWNIFSNQFIPIEVTRLAFTIANRLALMAVGIHDFGPTLRADESIGNTIEYFMNKYDRYLEGFPELSDYFNSALRKAEIDGVWTMQSDFYEDADLGNDFFKDADLGNDYDFSDKNSLFDDPGDHHQKFDSGVWN